MDRREKEVLAILSEECAEVIQSVSKIFRFGIDSSWEGETNREHLEEELGDVLAMIGILTSLEVVDISKLETAKQAKIKKLKQWSDIFKEE